MFKEPLPKTPRNLASKNCGEDSRPMGYEYYSKSTGFLKRSTTMNSGGGYGTPRSSRVPSTPTKPSLKYYSNRTNSGTLHFLYPPAKCSSVSHENNNSNNNNTEDLSRSDSYIDRTFTTITEFGNGNFADILVVRCKTDNLQYCIKNTRQKFTGFIDRYSSLIIIFL
jgi:hypothetical protein